MRVSKTFMWYRLGAKALSKASMIIGAPIEEGVGQMPQAYVALSETDRRSVRAEVRARLAQYQSADGKLTMNIEMLIGSGRA
jgi:hypothetical protein